MLVAIDTETTGVEWDDEPFLATVAYYDKQGNVSSFFYDLRNSHDRLRLQYLLYYETDKTDILVFHNAKFDLQKLRLAGFDIPEDKAYHDTMIMAHLLDENQPKGLKELARRYLNETTDEEDAIREAKKKYGLKPGDGYDKLPLDVVVPYALKDAEFTLRLCSVFYHMILDKDLKELYDREIKFSTALGRMETNGLMVNSSRLGGNMMIANLRLKAASKKFFDVVGKPVLEDHMLIAQVLEEPKRNKRGEVTRTHETKKEVAERVNTTCVNLNSPLQLKQLLFEHGIVVDSTGEDELKQYSDFPVVQSILEYREWSKMLNTYLKGVQKETGTDGLLHPHFRVTGTVTGRLSSGTGG